MKKITITINTENEAFQPPELEISAILHKLAERTANGFFHSRIYDVNGNLAGGMDYE